MREASAAGDGGAVAFCVREASRATSTKAYVTMPAMAVEERPPPDEEPISWADLWTDAANARVTWPKTTRPPLSGVHGA